MAALAIDRNTKRRPAIQRNFPLAAGVRIYEGAMVALDNTGYARPARATATDKIVGRAIFRADNSAGLAGAISVEVENDMACAYGNSASTDLIALTDIGADCYAVDDQTLALTSATSTRPRAGKIWNVTSDGVWVRFDQ
jgi:hypothetical protein